MITFEGILIGTGILWGLSALVVVPITNYLISKKLAEPAYAYISQNIEIAEDMPAFKSLVTRSYIMVDVLVLGIAGFLFGAVLGWFFIGISFESRGWPGMIAFIVMSMIGSSMHV